MNLILIGLRGSGKTTLGQHLSKKFKLPFIDLDKEIERHEKMSINEIVEKSGWDYFREIEKKVCKFFANQNNQLISTGGGTIIDNENAEALKKNGFIIYLHRLPEDCFEYIKDSKTRPNLSGKTPLDDLKQSYQKRDSIYRKNADLIIERTNDYKKDCEKIIPRLEF